MSRLSIAASWPVLTVGLALWLWLGWLCYANWRRSARPTTARWLEMLRFLLMTMLAATLLRPEFVKKIERTDKPEVAVLCDSSASMLTRDVVVSNQVVSRADWLERQKDAQFWKALESKAKVVVQEFSAPAAQTNVSKTLSGTDLHRALQSVLQREKNLKAVLLLSDGDWNQGPSPVSAAMRFREQNIPVFCVAVGREAPLPDLILEQVSAPSYGLFGEQIAIPFRIKSYLQREVRTSVRLLDGRREEVKKEIVIPAMGELQETILWAPRAVGDVSLTLRLPVEPDESLPENNEQSFRINVRVETLKVLVVDSVPRWEYRYLRNALTRILEWK